MALIELKRGPMDPGIYPFKVVNLEEKYGPSGFPYLALSLVCLGRGYKDTPVRSNLSLSPQARFRVEQFLDAIDAPSEGQIDSDAFIGKTVWAEIDHDTSSGEARANVTKWLRPPEDAEEYNIEDDLGDAFVDEKPKAKAKKIKELEDDKDLPF